MIERLATQGDVLVGRLYGYHTVEPDWQVSIPDGLDEHLIHFVVAGDCHGTVGGQPVHLGPGDAMWLPPRTGFRLHSPRSPATLYRFRLAAPAAPDGPGQVVLVPDAWEVRAALDALVAELGGGLGWRRERIRALLVIVMTTLLRLAERDDGPAPLTTRQRQVLEQWVDERLAERPAPSELAAVVELSPDYFARRFRQTYGVAPKVWLVRRRMARAAIELDESDRPILQIARQLGHQDGYLFSRQFKQVFGMSPRRWRTRSSRQ